MRNLVTIFDNQHGYASVVVTCGSNESRERKASRLKRLIVICNGQKAVRKYLVIVE